MRQLYGSHCSICLNLLTQEGSHCAHLIDQASIDAKQVSCKGYLCYSDIIRTHAPMPLAFGSRSLRYVA
jgi:hypothetical protein